MENRINELAQKEAIKNPVSYEEIRSFIEMLVAQGIDINVIEAEINIYGYGTFKSIYNFRIACDEVKLNLQKAGECILKKWINKLSELSKQIYSSTDKEYLKKNNGSLTRRKKGKMIKSWQKRNFYD